MRVAGCDLGKASASFALGEVDDRSRFTLVTAETVTHEGKPMDAFRTWYDSVGAASCAALGATGLYAGELAAPVLRGLPEDACAEAAIGLDPELTGPLNLISIGARGYSVLTRSADGHVQSLENDKCSSGTGETMVKIASRFGLTIEEADDIASSSADIIPITARCSVFAKSEMTHFGNQGKPAAALFRGYFGSTATYIAALLARVRVEGPVYVIGGGAGIKTLVAALGPVVGGDVRIPAHQLQFEAIGAAALAAEQLRSDRLAALPDDPDALVRPKAVQFRKLEAVADSASRVTRMQAPNVPAGAEQRASVLGLDLGSTGSKAVLTSVETGEPVFDVYDTTRGNPVDAAQRLIATLLDRVQPDVRGIALTGSGREAAATIIRATFPEMADRIGVVNEIVAHATAAIRCDERGGESLSVVEIGGQDAKFIQIVDGRITESDMNKACSAGTGSFLEEQAMFYGIDDIQEFTALAREAQEPPELGQMCTVFVAEAAAQANNEGYGRSDLFGGFQYSVIHNYINRVMGQRTFGNRVFFQGKPATGESLAWTLAAVTGRDVIVPPNPGAMGAWGVGLYAIDELGAAAVAGSAFDLTRVAQAEVVARDEFQCKVKSCSTLCSIERTTVAVAGGRHKVLSGGACPRYEISQAGKKKLDKTAPSAFDERKALLAPYLEEPTGDRIVGIPLVGALYGYLPWLVTLIRELGLDAKVLAPDGGSLSKGEARCYSFDACAPAKTAHGVVDADVDVVFFPKLITLPDRDGRGGRTCPMEQALPEMVRESLSARGRQVDIVHPVLSLEEGLERTELLPHITEAAIRLGADIMDAAQAMKAAAIAQRRYETELAAIGRRTLDYARREGLPAVVVCGSLHVIHDPVVNAGIPRLVRENGVLALPMDCFTLPGDTHPMPRIPWSDGSRALRTAVAARERGDAYPLLLSSFGCGPASFVEQIFATLMEGYPHTSLESDGHGGTAGYTTRVQAFLHTVERHDRVPKPVEESRLQVLEALDNPPITDDRDAHFNIFPIGDHLADIVAAGYRAHGLDVDAAGPNSAQSLALGRRDCSGKECLPYQFIWGGFRQAIEEGGDERHVLVQVNGEGMCRNCMFSIKDQISLERAGVDDRVTIRDFQAEPALGWTHMSKMAFGLTAWDILYQLASYHRPLEPDPGTVDATHGKFCKELESIIGRAAGGGLRAAVSFAQMSGATLDLLGRASRTYWDMGKQEPARHLPTVLVAGDIYLRVDEFASDDLVRRLNERDLKVLVEPAQTMFAYITKRGHNELFGVPGSEPMGRAMTAALDWIGRACYARVRLLHAWLPRPDIGAMLEESERVIDNFPIGEAPIAIGSVLHHWKEGLCDGAVIVSPWGCGPALISESLLRHRTEIPMLFVYCDGSPIDERRLNGFAFRLRRGPGRPADAATVGAG